MDFTRTTHTVFNQNDTECNAGVGQEESLETKGS